MTIIIVMIMKLFSGTMTIKFVRPKKQKLRKNFCLLFGIHDGGTGVFLWMREKRKKIVEEVVFDHLIC